MRTLWTPLLLVLLPLWACAHAAPAAPRAEPIAPPAPAPTPFFTATVSGAGRPVVLLPDLEAPGDVWEGTVAHLGGHYQVHVIQVAGFAGNPAASGPLMPGLRDGLAAYLRDHARGAILVGHMFGAQVAYWLAMTEPELVGGVIGIDAPPCRFDGAVESETEEIRQAWSAANTEQFALGVHHRIGSMMADSARAEVLATKAARSTQPVIAEAFYDMMTRDLRAQIPKIRAPVLTLLTLGNLPAEAVPYVRDFYQKQLDLIPHHELIVIGDSRHYVMFDSPEEFYSHVDRFLAFDAPGAGPSAAFILEDSKGRGTYWIDEQGRVHATVDGSLLAQLDSGGVHWNNPRGRKEADVARFAEADRLLDITLDGSTVNWPDCKGCGLRFDEHNDLLFENVDRAKTAGTLHLGSDGWLMVTSTKTAGTSLRVAHVVRGIPSAREVILLNLFAMTMPRP